MQAFLPRTQLYLTNGSVRISTVVYKDTQRLTMWALSEEQEKSKIKANISRSLYWSHWA